jgi:DNA-binding NarL/FixJ family response regulator
MEDAWRAVQMRHDLGEMAETMGRYNEARQHFETNKAHFSRTGNDQARDYYQMRLQQLEERAVITASDIVSSPPIPVEADEQSESGEVSSSVEPLSTREIEVLALLAGGLTNREIAQRLYISPNTVRVHTYHIYDKLDVSNRTEAAAKARALRIL